MRPELWRTRGGRITGRKGGRSELLPLNPKGKGTYAGVHEFRQWAKSREYEHNAYRGLRNVGQHRGNDKTKLGKQKTRSKSEKKTQDFSSV